MAASPSLTLLLSSSLLGVLLSMAGWLVQAPFFAAPVTLGPKGVEKVHPLGPLSALEQEALDKAVPDLIAQVTRPLPPKRRRIGQGRTDGPPHTARMRSWPLVWLGGGCGVCGQAAKGVKFVAEGPTKSK